MNRCFLVYYILFIPIICSNNITSKIVNDHNKTTITNDITKELSNAKTKPTMVSEGGPLLLKNQTVILPKDSFPIDLETVDKELETTKLKSIQPRKGVGKPSDEIMSHENLSTVPSEMNRINTLPVQSHMERNTSVTNLNITHNTSQHILNNPTVIAAPEHVSLNKVHKKPHILSFETLDKNNKIVKTEGMISLVKSTSNTLVDDQILSPNRDVKSYKMATKHPGLVTPVVITILIVPVFALLGYMAFKRGQEAWRNRHYKRMDFLLDGMYNE